jgi:hypothetical protein
MCDNNSKTQATHKIYFVQMLNRNRLGNCSIMGCEIYWPIGAKTEDEVSRIFRRFASSYQTTRRYS